MTDEERQKYYDEINEEIRQWEESLENECHEVAKAMEAIDKGANK